MHTLIYPHVFLVFPTNSTAVLNFVSNALRLHLFHLPVVMCLCCPCLFHCTFVPATIFRASCAVPTCSDVDVQLGGVHAHHCPHDRPTGTAGHSGCEVRTHVQFGKLLLLGCPACTLDSSDLAGCRGTQCTLDSSDLAEGARGHGVLLIPQI